MLYPTHSSFFTQDQHLLRFLRACGENWRDCLYLECGSCDRACAPRCRDLLCTFDADGTPLYIPVHDAECYWQTTLDKSECLACLSAKVFRSLYRNWFFTHTHSLGACALLDACPTEGDTQGPLAALTHTF